MADELFRLIYVSRCAIKGDDATFERAIAEILSTARQYNKRDQLTGALLFNRQVFAQVLEGPQQAIEDTFERIQCDPRHTDTTVLSFQAIDERCFAQWSMGYEGADTPALAAFNRLTSETRGKLESLNGVDLLRLMKAHLQADA